MRLLGVTGQVVAGGFDYDIGEGLAVTGGSNSLAKFRSGGFLHQFADTNLTMQA